MDDVTPWQESLLSALHDGIPDAMLLPLATVAGAPADAAAAFVARISPALIAGARPRLRVRVELPADIDTADAAALAGALDVGGVEVVATTRWAEPEPDPAVPVILVAYRLVDPRRAATLMARDVPHLPLELAGDRVIVRTAGSAPAAEVRPTIVTALDEIGVSVGAEFPKPLTDGAVKSADVVVTMGCGDACPVYPGRRYLDWDLDDPVDQPLATVRRIRDDIDNRVRHLLVELFTQPSPI